MAYSYTTTEPFKSVLMPGVVFNLRKMAHRRRIALNEKAAVVRAEVESIRSQWNENWVPIRTAREAAQLEPCICSEHAHPDNLISCDVPGCKCRELGVDAESLIRNMTLRENLGRVIVEKLYPIYIEWGVKSIEGLLVDGENVTTTEQLLDVARDEAIEELGMEIERMINLTFDEQMGFKSLGTGSTQGTEPSQSTNVPTAEKTNSTGPVLVTATTPDRKS